MKKLIFIATMFLISVSANSQIKDVTGGNGSFIHIIDQKGNDFRTNVGELMGWTSTYVLVLSGRNSDGQSLYIFDSQGNKTTMSFNSKRNSSEPDWIITAITPNYFKIKNVDGEFKYDNKGHSIW